MWGESIWVVLLHDLVIQVGVWSVGGGGVDAWCELNFGLDRPLHKPPDLMRIRRVQAHSELCEESRQ
jgi:hypothetical protein